METSRQPERPPDFNDAQLQYIAQLAKRDGFLCAFIESMDQRAISDLSRTAIISGVAYRAAEILGYRQKAREAKEKALADALAKAKERIAAEGKPQEVIPARIPADQIPDIKVPPNGAPEAKPEG
jgi:hypothetical protein